MTSWCFSGPLENWRYEIERAVWATNNDHNHSKWFEEMMPRDTVIMYATKRWGVIGYCYIADKATKNDPWWDDEVKQGENLYPNVIYINDVHLVASIEEPELLSRYAVPIGIASNAGLSRRNITGGVNVIRDITVFPRIQKLLTHKNEMHVYYSSYKESPDLSAIREELTEKYSTSHYPIDTTDSLDLSDLSTFAPLERIETIIQLWRRNRWLVEKRKLTTKGRCEISGCTYEPFKELSGKVYSEAHHIIPLGDPGSENIQNIAILCPNHHREIHYGANSEQLTLELKSKHGLL